MRAAGLRRGGQLRGVGKELCVDREANQLMFGRLSIGRRRSRGRSLGAAVEDGFRSHERAQI